MQSLRCSYTRTAVLQEQGQAARTRLQLAPTFVPDFRPIVILCNSGPREGQRKGQVIRDFMTALILVFQAGVGVGSRRVVS